MFDLDKFEEAGKEITDKISDYDIKILYEMLKASDPDIIGKIIEYRYGVVGIAENEIALILRVITSNYIGYYVAKFMEKEIGNIKKSLKEVQDRLDKVLKKVGRMK
jgi:predicted amino acid racemase